MFIAVLLIFCLSTLAVDYIDQGRCVWDVCISLWSLICLQQWQVSNFTTLNEPSLIETQLPWSLKKTSYSLLIFFSPAKPSCVPPSIPPSLSPSLPACLLFWQEKDRAINPSEYFCCCFGQCSNDLVAVYSWRLLSLILTFLTGISASRQFHCVQMIPHICPQLTLMGKSMEEIMTLAIGPDEF